MRNPPFMKTTTSFTFISLDQGTFEMDNLNSGVTIINNAIGNVIVASSTPESVGLSEDTVYLFSFVPEAYH